MGHIKQNIKAYKPKKKMSSVVAKQNARSKVLKSVAVTPHVIADIAKNTAVDVMRPTEMLSGQAENAYKLSLNRMVNEVSFLRSREVYLKAKGDELRDLVANLTHEIRAEDGICRRKYNAKRRQVNRLKND
jgi:hypothetical protein